MTTTHSDAAGPRLLQSETVLDCYRQRAAGGDHGVVELSRFDAVYERPNYDASRSRGGHERVIDSIPNEISSVTHDRGRRRSRKLRQRTASKRVAPDCGFRRLLHRRRLDADRESYVLTESV